MIFEIGGDSKNQEYWNLYCSDPDAFIWVIDADSNSWKPSDKILKAIQIDFSE